MEPLLGDICGDVRSKHHRKVTKRHMLLHAPIPSDLDSIPAQTTENMWFCEVHHDAWVPHFNACEALFTNIFHGFLRSFAPRKGPSVEPKAWACPIVPEGFRRRQHQ